MKIKASDEKTSDGVPQTQRPKVIESYVDYLPPFKVGPLVQRMLDTVPAEYLNGLSEVILTNIAGLSKSRRRSVTTSRKRKVRVFGTGGLYHPAWRGNPAWIEIFVDNCLNTWKRSFWLRFKFVREIPMAEILFHELGHHVHFTRRPEYRNTEDVADTWKVRLQRRYYAERYPLFRMLVHGLKIPFGKLIDSVTDKSLRSQLRKRWISRAEFDERMKD